MDGWVVIAIMEEVQNVTIIIGIKIEKIFMTETSRDIFFSDSLNTLDNNIKVRFIESDTCSTICFAMYQKYTKREHKCM